MRHQETSNSLVPSSRQILQASKLQFAVAVALGLLLGAASMRALADSTIRAVRLSNIVGTVQVANGTDGQFSQAYPNMPLMQGSTLQTGEDGRAEIQFEDGSVARLTPNSSARTSVLQLSSDGNTNTQLDLLTGLSYVVMSGRDNQRFVVHFGDNEVISPAPVKFRVSLDANPIEFAVLDGSAKLSHQGAFALDVKTNETVRFDATDGGRYFLAEGVDGDSWDQWNTDRDQAMNAMAAQQTREARGSMNPNDPGWSDLDYYGNWYPAPGGGSFWSPNGAGAGWDPYGSGYWGSYGGGYGWISSYPWGWLPYHCGAWSYYNSYGWGWMPNGCGTGWYPTSGIGYAPANYRPVQRPVSPTGHLPHHGPVLIAVNRGPAATTLNPTHAGGGNRTVAVINGRTEQPLAKTPNPVVARSFNGGGTAVTARPMPVASRPGAPSAFQGGPPSSTVQVYRPVSSAPPSSASVYHSSGEPPVAPSHPSGGGGQFSSPHASAPSAPSAPSASHGGGGTSSGGGHVK